VAWLLGGCSANMQPCSEAASSSTRSILRRSHRRSTHPGECSIDNSPPGCAICCSSGAQVRSGFGEIGTPENVAFHNSVHTQPTSPQGGGVVWNSDRTANRTIWGRRRRRISVERWPSRLISPQVSFLQLHTSDRSCLLSTKPSHLPPLNTLSRCVLLP
jgi:hypothetical protein